MEYYYAITPIQAALISKFLYAVNEEIDPFVGEQVSGRFLVSQPMYELLKDRPELKKFNWNTVPLIPKDQLNPKPTPFPPTT